MTADQRSLAAWAVGTLRVTVVFILRERSSSNGPGITVQCT